MDEPRDLGLLFHRLNNQLGIILANAELLEAKSADEMARARALKSLRACSTRWRPPGKSASAPVLTSAPGQTPIALEPCHRGQTRFVRDGRVLGSDRLSDGAISSVSSPISIKI